MRAVKTEWHNEDCIESSLRRILKDKGWQVDERLQPVGSDIIAFDPNGKLWNIEVKGYPATYYKKNGSPKPSSTIKTQRGVWFIEALGQICCRMKDPDGNFGIVFPDHSKDLYFERRSLEISATFRTKVNLWFLMLSEDNRLRTLAPNSSSFDKSGETLFNIFTK